MQWLVNEISSPIGALTCVLHEGRLVALDFEGNADRLRRLLTRRFGAVALPPGTAAGSAARAIEAYFEGDWRALDGVVVDLGGTPFERRVYDELRRIPRGEVTTYAAIARRIGNPEAVRAVGAANGKNPVSIVVPCHRVIGRDGSLTGYAGGLDRKRWLLTHEGVALSDRRSQKVFVEV